MKRTLTKKEKTALNALGVGLVLVFGSEITGKRHPGSNVDVGVVFHDLKRKNEDPVEVYGELYEIFSNLFPVKPLDIVYLQESPLHLQFRAISGGKVLYRESLSFEADYRERVMLLYFDFAPVEQVFQRAMIQGV